MRTLVIPDIHNKVDVADQIVANNQADEVVFLGDYFDEFYDTTQDAVKTARWLERQLSTPGRVCLVGNHDMGYLFDDERFLCSGYSVPKRDAIRSAMDHKIVRAQLLPAYAIDNQFLLSHAGLHCAWLTGHKDSSPQALEALIGHAYTHVLQGEFHTLFGAGRSRGGTQAYGGVTWCDYREFAPVIGVRQIFGHSKGLTVRSNFNRDICLDTNLKHFAIIAAGNVTIHAV